MSQEKPGQLYWSRIDPYWDRLTNAWDGGPSEFLAAMDAVPVRIRHLYAAHWFISEVMNGGLHQFFYNTTGILAPEAAEGLSCIGANGLTQVLLESMRHFGESYPRDRDLRMELLPDLDDELRFLEANPFSPLDERFYDWFNVREYRWEQMADRYATDA